jgi:MYXO-CTERM domain-containing protein
VPFVPEADAGVLLLGGLVGLAALAWWRRQR